MSDTVWWNCEICLRFWYQLWKSGIGVDVIFTVYVLHSSFFSFFFEVWDCLLTIDVCTSYENLGNFQKLVDIIFATKTFLFFLCLFKLDNVWWWLRGTKPVCQRCLEASTVSSRYIFEHSKRFRISLLLSTTLWIIVLISFPLSHLILSAPPVCIV